MKIIDLINEGKNKPIVFNLPQEWGGGKMKIEIDIWSDGFLGKYSFAYINVKWCKKFGRLIGVDSTHPGHPSDLPHYHYCGISRDLPNSITLHQVIDIFVTNVTKVIMKNINNKLPLSLSEEEQDFLNQIPGFSNFMSQTENLITEGEKALARNREYYRRNPDAPPITRDTPPLEDFE